jgi:hypothetical protein
LLQSKCKEAGGWRWPSWAAQQASKDGVGGCTAGGGGRGGGASSSRLPEPGSAGQKEHPAGWVCGGRQGGRNRGGTPSQRVVRGSPVPDLHLMTIEFVLAPPEK